MLLLFCRSDALVSNEHSLSCSRFKNEQGSLKKVHFYFLSRINTLKTRKVHVYFLSRI